MKNIKHLLRICIWLKSTDHGDLCHSFLEKDEKVWIVQTLGEAALNGDN